MTVSAAILKVVATLSSSEKGRKAIGVALLTPVIILLLVVGVFVALLTGLFGLLYGAVRDTSVSQSWNDIRKNVESALSGVNSSINTQIKNDTYDFMPDFSINLSSGLDNDIASAIENVSSDESGGATADGFDVACLNVFQAQEIGQIFERAALEGKFSAKVNTEKNDTTEKLSITVKTPSEDDWYEMFNVDEKYRDYTKENTQIIERILSDAQINDLYISVDSTAQRALFVYFQGFFNLPVEADDLKENTNGILTTLNDFETIHSRGTSTIGKAYESGITLYLNDEDTEVRAEILPDVGECIQDVYIYDVYDAEKRKVVKDIRNICLCLDNDSAGRTAAKEIASKLRSMGYVNVYERYPNEKDYNDELKKIKSIINEQAEENEQ